MRKTIFFIILLITFSLKFVAAVPDCFYKVIRIPEDQMCPTGYICDSSGCSRFCQDNGYEMGMMLGFGGSCGNSLICDCDCYVSSGCLTCGDFTPSGCSSLDANMCENYYESDYMGYARSCLRQDFDSAPSICKGMYEISRCFLGAEDNSGGYCNDILNPDSRCKCADGTDNDYDGKIDCADDDGGLSSCKESAVCKCLNGGGSVSPECCEMLGVYAAVSDGLMAWGDSSNMFKGTCSSNTAYCADTGETLSCVEHTDTNALSIPYKNSITDCSSGGRCCSGVINFPLCNWDGGGGGGGTGPTPPPTPPSPEPCSPIGATTVVDCGSSNIGECHYGERTSVCTDDGTWSMWSDCIGAAYPTAETCGDNLDQDCNGADLPCSPPPGCGNGIIVSPEQCEGTNLNGKTCANLGQGFTGGTLSCKSDCTFDTQSCTSPLPCGNNQIDAGESCDGTNLNGKICSNLGQGFTGGTLSCKPDCTFNTAACTTTCGDGDTGGTETCDDGNTVSGDGCSDSCRKERCGDRIVTTSDPNTIYIFYTGVTLPEQCDRINLDGKTCRDFGKNLESGLACNSNCTFNTDGCANAPTCGNWILDSGETCDNGIPCDFGLECDYLTCKCVMPPPSCGNGVFESSEQCDDGNKVNGDGCSAFCIKETCGDNIQTTSNPKDNYIYNQWITFPPGEECDSGITCTGSNQICKNCKCVTYIAPEPDPLPECGNWIREGTEQCDDGNRDVTPGDGCSASCTIEPGSINSAPTKAICTTLGTNLGWAEMTGTDLVFTSWKDPNYNCFKPLDSIDDGKDECCPNDSPTCDRMTGKCIPNSCAQYTSPEECSDFHPSVPRTELSGLLGNKYYCGYNEDIIPTSGELACEETVDCICEWVDDAGTEKCQAQAVHTVIKQGESSPASFSDPAALKAFCNCDTVPPLGSCGVDTSLDGTCSGGTYQTLRWEYTPTPVSGFSRPTYCNGEGQRYIPCSTQLSFFSILSIIISIILLLAYYSRKIIK
jgi:cysteine-rich repeat protein